MTSTSRITAILATAFSLALGASAALAHDDATLDIMNAPHGGQLRMAGIYHFELVVVKDAKGATTNSVLVYVTDHVGQKIATTGAIATATLLTGKTKATTTLQPDGDNRLKGVAPYVSSPDLKAVVSVTLKGAQPEQARFTPLALAPAEVQAQVQVQDEHMEHQH